MVSGMYVLAQYIVAGHLWPRRGKVKQSRTVKLQLHEDGSGGVMDGGKELGHEAGALEGTLNLPLRVRCGAANPEAR